MKLKKVVSIILAFVFMFVSTLTPGSAYAADKAKSKTVYESVLGNKVIEVTAPDGKSINYVVVSKPVIYNDLKNTEELKKKATMSKSENIVGQRVYFQMTENVEEAKMVSDQPAGDAAVQGIRGNFWNGSYVEEDYSIFNGNGWHLFLSSADTTKVVTAGAIMGQTLGQALLVALEVAAFPAAFFAAAAVSLLVWYAYSNLTNSDGSFDMYGYQNDLPAKSGCVSSGEWLGSYKVRNTGNWYGVYWPSSWSGFCL